MPEAKLKGPEHMHILASASATDETWNAVPDALKGEAGGFDDPGFECLEGGKPIKDDLHKIRMETEVPSMHKAGTYMVR